MLSKNRGITLVSLVITIIVMLILAGVALSSVTGDNSILTMATKTSITQKLATYKEEFELSKTAAKMKAIRENGKIDSEEFEESLAGEAVKDYIPSLQPEDYDKIAIYEGKLVYSSDDISENDKSVVDGMEVNMMQGEDTRFLIGMTKMANFAKAKKSSPVGTAITSQSEAVTIAGITYSLGWHKITTADEFRALGFTDENEINFMMNYKPYIIKYSNSAVQSVIGKQMYKDTDNPTWKFTFNYTGKGENENSIAINSLLSGVTKNSVATGNKFGDFVPNKTYAQSGTTANVIEDYYKEEYEYDADGGVILKEKTNILSMPIDQTKEINKRFSVNITFKADLLTAQQGKPSYGGNVENNTWGSGQLGGCLLAISDLNGKDICSVRIRNGLLTVITFTNNGTPENTFTVKQGEGYAVLDVKGYNNKFINLNIIAERGGQTKVFINGSLVSTFKSGNKDFSYKSFTIGDLRSGRGMKFFGTVYNFGLYGELLTDEEVMQNWQYTKKQLGINNAGDKI